MARKPRLQNVNRFYKKAIAVISSFLGSIVLKFLTFLIDKLRIWRFELTYKLHLSVRSLHDNLVVQSPTYKKITESRYTEPVRRATIGAFFASLAIFLTLQYILPNFFKPNQAMAGSQGAIFTNNADFQMSKAGLCNNTGTVQANLLISGTPYTDTTCANSTVADSNVTLTTSDLPLTNVTQVSAGSDGTLALKSDGTVWAWGNNGNGNVGDNTTASRTLPVQVLGAGGSGFLTNVSYVYAGASNSFAVKTDGTVWAWGYNGGGLLGDNTTTNRLVPVQVVGAGGSGFLTNVKEVSSSYGGTVAVKNDGTIWAWGPNSHGEVGDNTVAQRLAPVQVLGAGGVGNLTNVNHADIGLSHSIAVKNDGSVWSWGDNTYGQLGDNTTTQRKTPIQVLGVGGSGNISGITKVQAEGGSNSKSSSFALKNDGTVWAWGGNYDWYAGGMLGDNTTTQRNTPVQVVGVGGTGFLTGITDIYSGPGGGGSFGLSTVALKSDGTTYGWGINQNGQLGDGTTTTRNAPVQMAITNASKITIGSYDTYILKSDGSLWGVGYGSNLGVYKYQENAAVTSFKIVLSTGTYSSFTNVSQISTGGNHSIALKTDGTVWVWGSSSYGELGQGTNSSVSKTPVQVRDSTGTGFLTGITQVVAGYTNMYALKNDGTVWSWGYGFYGANGDNTIGPRYLPVQVVGSGGVGYLTGITSIVANSNTYSAVLALKNDQTVWGWGTNGAGQLGDNTTTQRNAPVQVKGVGGVGFLTGITSIGMGGNSSYAVKSDGTAWSWGMNSNGQLGDNTTTQRLTPVQVVGTGGSGFLSNVSAISGGGTAGYALKADGTVWSWGLNTSGQLGDNTTTQRPAPVQVVGTGGSGLLTGVSKIQAGSSTASMEVLKSDNTVWSWGNNGSGTLGDNTTTQRPAPVQVVGSGGTGTLTGITSISNPGGAVKNDGTLWTWGYNGSGQLGDNTITDRYAPVQPVVFNCAQGYSTSGTITGLRVDAGNPASWATLSWAESNGAGALSGTSYLRFRTRGAASSAGLTSATWSSYMDFQSGTSGSAAITTTSSQFLEVELTLVSSDGAATPSLDWFKVSYDTLENPVNGNTTLTHTGGSAINKSDGTSLAAGVGGGWTNETSINITSTGLTCGGGASGNTACVNTSTARKIQVQAALVSDSSFSSPLSSIDANTSSSTPDGGVNYTSTATITGLVPGSSYHVRVRSTDSAGRVSSWTAYAADATAFTTDQVAPTVSITLNSGATYASSTTVTVNVTAADADSKLSKLFLSNDGSNWTDSTPSGSAFASQSVFSGNVSWTVPTGDGAKKVYAKTIDNGGNDSSLFTQTSDADFNSGLTKTYVTSTSGTLALTTNSYAAYAPNYIAGLPSTALQGKYVYNTYFTNISWGPNSSCPQGSGGTQPCQVGLDSGYPANAVLVSPQAYPSLNFTAYPAQSACAAIGGRLPTTQEGLAMIAAQSTYGNNFFGTWQYPTATEMNSGSAYSFNPSSGIGSVSKTLTTLIMIRCVSDSVSSSPYFNPGLFESSIHDAGTANLDYGKLNYTSSVPGGTSLTVSVRGGNTATPDGTWTSYATIASGNSASVLNGKRYVQYKVDMTGGAATPSLNDISIDVFPSASINLDATAPTGSASINAGQVSTNSTGVSVDVTANDTGGSNLNKLYLSNDGSTWVDKTPGSGFINQSSYSGTISGWTLSSGDGTKTVYAKYLDNAGNIGGGTYTQTSTFTVPSGVASISVSIIGAGGGGGGAGSANIPSGPGQPGAAGGTSSVAVGGVTYTASGGGGGATASGVNWYTAGTAGSNGATNTHGLASLTGISGGGGSGGNAGTYMFGGPGGAGGAGGKITGTIPVSTGQTVTIVSGSSGVGGSQLLYGVASTNGAAGSVSVSYGTITDNIILDTISPTLSSVSVSPSPFSPNASVGTKDASIISYTTADNLSGNVNITIRIYDGASLIRDLLTNDSESQAIHTVSWDGKNDSSAYVSDKSYTYKIDETDAATNTAVQQSGSIVVDNTLPVISSAHLTSSNPTNTLAKVGDTITLTMTISDTNLPVTTPSVSISGNSAAVSGVSPSFTATYQLTSGDIESSSIAFSISGFMDSAGNTGTTVTSSTDSSAVKFDKTNPTSLNIGNISPNPNNTGNQTIYWDSFADSGVSSNFQKYVIERKLGAGGSYTQIDTETVVGNTSYTDNSNLVEGSYYYHVISYDNAGNSSTGAVSGVLTVDKTLPNVSIAPSYNSNPNKTGNQTLTWDAFADNGGSGFKNYTLQRKELSPVLGVYVTAATITDVAVHTYADNSNLAEGTYIYRVQTTDNANNTATSSDSSALNIDKTSPTGSISVNEGLSTQLATIHLTISVADTGGSNLAYYELQNENSGWSSPISIPSSPSSFTDPNKSWDLSPGDSNKTISFRFYDGAGNMSTTHNVNIYHDTTPPSDVSGMKMYQDGGKSNNITADNVTKWYPYTSTYFEWDASSAGSGINTYKYCFSTDSNCTPTTPTTGNAAHFTASLDASLDNSYYLRVIAVSNVLLPSNNVTTFQYNFDKTVPAAITGFTPDTADYADTQIKLKWNAVPTNNGAPLDNYKIERVESLSYPGLTGNWSGLNGYAVFTTTNLSFVDDVNATNQTLQDQGVSLISGQMDISPSTRYAYRISAKDQSNASYGDYQNTPQFALTRDVSSPEFPPVIGTGQGATACDGTTNTCEAHDSGDNSVNTKGLSVKVTWTAAFDIGSGVAKYKIYRTTNETDPNSWKVVGVKYTPTGMESTVWYDNDAHNDATFGNDKPVSTTRINDSTIYYYRITAVDGATPGNETALFPSESDPHSVTDQNLTRATTPDVTPPTVPADVSVNAQGLDHTNEHQQINISWAASTDYKARSEEVLHGTITYHVYRSTSPNGPWDNLVKTTTDTGFNDEGLSATTTYYYRVSAFDKVPNESELSNLTDTSSALTYSSEVPDVPSNINVATTKGDPNTDSTVGHTATISFTGSHSNAYQITKYDIWRSATNTTGNCHNGEKNTDCWLRVNSATKIQTVNITATPDDRGHTHSVTDTGLSGATIYYYRVWAQDNTSVPGHPEQSNLYSGLSTISSGTLHVGWDITPDSSAPDQPTGLKVKDIHDDGMNFKRNIITWSRIATPTRNSVNDFSQYKIYRSDDGLAWEEICQSGTSTTLLPSCTVQNPNPLFNGDKELALANNYFMDLIPLSEANQFYYYYVTAVDDAGTAFKYASPNQNTVINSVSNESKPVKNSEGNISSVSLNPAIAQPSILAASNGKKANLDDIGVSTAVVSWTTDQPADTIVEFRKHGTEDPYLGVVNREMVINHQITAKPLEPNTTYDYRIISRNSLANDVIAEGVDLPTLTTTGFNIVPGPVSTTTSTAEINWTTNLDASSAFVEYQLQKQPGDDAQGGTSGVEPNELASSPRNHRVVIKGLRSNRTYTYKLKSISKDGFLAEYPIGDFSNFRTRNFDSAQFSLAPASSNVADKNITSTTAQIIWQTATETTSWVDYGTTSGVFGISSGNDNLTTTHLVTLEGLVPGTKYYYHVRVKDANEVEFTSQEYSFTAVIKPKISNMQVKNVTPYSVTVSWDTNVDTETVLNWGKTTAYGEKHGNAGNSQVHQVTVENLEDNQEYHYQIVAHDGAGNEVVGLDSIVRTPLDTEGPKIANAKLDVLPMGENDTTASIIISWQTNKPATTLVEYDEGIIGGSYNSRSTEDTSLNTSHTVIVKNLKAAASYHYRMVSADKRSNLTQTQDYTFVTPSKEKSVLELILKSLEETFAWTGHMNQFFGNLGKRFTGKN